MRPNVEFRVDLPKTNPSLAKPHLQRHMATRKKKRPSTDISCTECIQEFCQILYSIQSTLFNERVTFRIWPSTTNCPVKSILQVTHAIDKLFSICLIYYQNKHNLFDFETLPLDQILSANITSKFFYFVL